MATYPNTVRLTTITIANGGTTSGSFALNGASVVGIYFPAMTSTSVALQVSPDNGTTWFPITNAAGTAQALTTAGTARFITASNTLFFGATHGRLVAGSSEGAERTIQVAMN